MKPLSKKTRLFSVGILLFVFLVLAPFIISNSFGYRLGDAGVVKTGGIYIHSDLTDTEIFVDGEYLKNNGVLLRNSLIQKLTPGQSYRIDINKEGYHSWNKTLSVQESLVTEARIMMLPLEIEMEAIYPYVDSQGNATTTAAGAEILPTVVYQELQKNFGLIETESEKLEKILETKIDLATSTELQKDVPEYFVDLGVENPDDLENLITNGNEVSWLEDGQIILNWVGDEDDAIPYYYCITIECRQEIVLDWEGVQKFAYLPGRSDVWVVLTSSGVWAVEVDDRSDRNIQSIYEGENLDFIVNNNNRIVVLDEEVFYELRF